MALPPTDAYFYFDEPTSDFRGLLYQRGIPRSNITYECSPHFSHKSKVTRYTIIDANRPDKFSEAEEIIDVLLAFDCTKENLQQVIDFFQPPIMLAFTNEQSCLEYLYVLISQALYGAIIDFDETEIFDILQAYKAGRQSKIGIINCFDANKMNHFPINASLFFTNAVNSMENAHKILTATTVFKTMSKHADKCTTALIVTPLRKSYQKVFWCE